MDLPYEKRGKLCWGSIRLELNNCSFGQIRSVISMPDFYQAQDYQYALFVADIELGEIQVLIDMLDDRLLQLELELFEDLPLNQVMLFLKEEGIISDSNFGYVEDEGEIYLVFNLHFMMRLTADTNKICTFVFYNSDFMRQNEDEFAVKIRTAAKQKKQDLN